MEPNTGINCKSLPPEAVSVLMVGAGPVGLWTAIQVKTLLPDLEVQLLDKYEVYKRRQLIKLDPKSFRGIPKHCPLTAVIAEWAKASFVRIKKIEEDLKRIATELGIGFEVTHVEEPLALRERYPKAGVIVGSDGYHSIVRKKIFGDLYYENIPLQHIIQVRYRVMNTAKKSGLIRATAMQTLSGTYVNEHIGKEMEDGRREITARFVVAEAVHAVISDAKAKEPWEITDERVPDNLRIQISNWMRARKAAGLEEWQDENFPRVELTAIHLSAYRSREIVKIEKGRARETCWVLAGDSLSGVPYFRSLAKGFREGTRLARNIADAIISGFVSKKIFSGYVNFACRLYAKERRLAKLKAQFIKTVGLGVKLGRICTPEFGLRMYARVTLNLHSQEWDPRGDPFPVHPADRALDFILHREDDHTDDSKAEID